VARYLIAVLTVLHVGSEHYAKGPARDAGT